MRPWYNHDTSIETRVGLRWLNLWSGEHYDRSQNRLTGDSSVKPVVVFIVLTISSGDSAIAADRRGKQTCNGKSP